MLFSRDKLTLDRNEKEQLWDFVKAYSESHEFLLYTGISFHKQLWLKASGALALKESNPGYYDALRRLALDYPNPDFA